MNLLIIDNFDSFTYNLVQQLLKVAQSFSDRPQHSVFRNNELTVPDIKLLNPSHIIISPGPGDSTAGGVSQQVLAELPGFCPILGVCLGMQLMAAACGGTIIQAPKPIHGHQELIQHQNQSIFAEIKTSPFKVARYHSLIVEPGSLPSVLAPLAYAADGSIMALRHKHFPWIGIQFHPESFLTEEGDVLIENFLRNRF